MNGLPSVDQLNRLAKAVMQQRRISYPAALDLLGTFRLHLVCSAPSISLVQYQAALLTAVNCGKRAFLGGVTVQLPVDTTCTLPGWEGKALASVVESLGGKITADRPESEKTLLIGENTSECDGDVTVFADAWRGGFSPTGTPCNFKCGASGPLGGIFAAGLVIARAFGDVSGASVGGLEHQFGMSLWRPDVAWLTDAAYGPAIVRLPQKLWLLGLGHLGQAYVWALGLLPTAKLRGPLLILQDYDRITSGNWCAGALSEMTNVGAYKSRVCAQWIESRGFESKLVERAFDSQTQVQPDEPRVALCGFDSASGRRTLEDAGFDLIVECGLGSSLSHFDRIILHTFPNAAKCPRDIWPSGVTADAADFDRALFEPEDVAGQCGILVDDLARKPISASFVGMCAAALVVAEVLRGLHGGQRYDMINTHLRSNGSPRAVPIAELYQLRHSLNGSLSLVG